MLVKESNAICMAADDAEHVLSMVCITRDFIETAKNVKTDEQRKAFIEKAYRYVSLQGAAEEKLNEISEYLADAKNGIDDFRESASGLFYDGKQALA